MMDAQTGLHELAKIIGLQAPDLVPALAIPILALVISAATALGWSGTHLAERLLSKSSRRG